MSQGHTAGSVSVLFRSAKDTVLFSGDHLAYTESRQGLDGFRQYNHGNEFMQALSIRLLADDSYPFTCKFIYMTILSLLLVCHFHFVNVCRCQLLVGLLPSHGRMARFPSLSEKRAAVLKAAEEFEKEGGRRGQFAVGYY